MKRFVLDCSMTMSWFFEDEATQVTDTVHDSLAADSQALVPAIWPLEVINSFLVAERRKRINKLQTSRYLSHLKILPIEIDFHTHDQVFGDILRLAREHHLSSYDAAYLELANRLNLPLATLDKNLQKAAKRSGLSLI